MTTAEQRAVWAKQVADSGPDDICSALEVEVVVMNCSPTSTR